MTPLQTLKHEYPGDAAWQDYVAAFSTNWEAISDQKRFVEKFKDYDISVVLSSLLGERSLAWFDRPIGALENLSPAAVFKNNKDGKVIVRSLIMRLPV